MHHSLIFVELELGASTIVFGMQYLVDLLLVILSNKDMRQVSHCRWLCCCLCRCSADNSCNNIHGAENLDELISGVMQRIGAGIGGARPQLLYEDDEGDKVLLATDGDLIGAVSHVRSAGLKYNMVYKLFIACPKHLLRSRILR